MVPLIAALALGPWQAQGAEQVKAIVAYLPSKGPLVTLPSDFRFPATPEAIAKVFPDDDYVTRPAKGGIALVIHRSVEWVKADLNALVLLKELAKRPDPFAAITIRSLPRAAQDAAIGYIDMVQPKPFRAIDDNKLLDCAFALEFTTLAYISHEGVGRQVALPLPRPEEDHLACREALIARPVLKREPTESDLARLMSAPSDVVVRHYGGDIAGRAENLSLAAEELVLYLDELKKSKATAFSDLLPVVDKLFASYLQGAKFGETSRVFAGEGSLKRELASSLVMNWERFRFKSRDEAQAFVQLDHQWRLQPLVAIRWCQGPSRTGQLSWIEVEIFRGQ